VAPDGQPPADSQKPIFRSAVDLVSVSAVVRDRKGRVVRGLDREDFLVLDGGRPARIVEFRSSDTGPVSLALLFDVSGSMSIGAKLDDARQAAHHVLSTLEPATGDEAALFTFDTSLRELAPFTADLDRLREGLDQLNPYGATSLFDAVADTARRVVTRDVKRRAVIVLTDGVDTSSRMTAAEVSGIASEIDVPVFIIAAVSPLEHPAAASPLGASRPEEEGLDSLSAWTGGELFVVSAPSHASVAARRIVADLRHQYLIAFEASAVPGWHPLEIRTRDRDHSVRARSGYTRARGRPSV
jgi:VWFA-related protein